jgi:hypothetical protein
MIAKGGEGCLIREHQNGNKHMHPFSRRQITSLGSCNRIIASKAKNCHSYPRHTHTRFKRISIFRQTNGEIFTAACQAQVSLRTIYRVINNLGIKNAIAV